MGYRIMKEGPGRPDPEMGVRRFFSFLWTNIWKLIGANLLFVLFSLPVVTIPGALCALNRICVLLYREGHCFLWQDFIQEFRRSFLRTLLPGVLFGALLFAGYFFMSLAAGNAALPLWSMLFWSIGILLTGSSVCWAVYYFVLAAMLELKSTDLLKNAAILCFLRHGRAVLVLVFSLGTAFVAAILMPVFIVMLALCWFALVQYTLCCLVYAVADAYILQPYEAGKSE